MIAPHNTLPLDTQHMVAQIVGMPGGITKFISYQNMGK